MEGNLRFTGSRKALATSNPAFSGSAASVANLMPAPLLPPVPVAASYVPEECHAKRMRMGAIDPSSQDGLSIMDLSSARMAGKRGSKEELLGAADVAVALLAEEADGV